MKLIRNIFLAAGIIFYAGSDIHAQSTKAKNGAQAAPQELPWKENRKLVWSDFTGKAGPKETKYALTTSGISVGTQCVEGKFNYQVKAVFVPKESWTRDRTNDDLLAHEQLHFDITELHARKLRLIFSMLPDGCHLNQQQISDLVNPIYAESDKMQHEYDKATNHGINKEVQRQWQKLVEESLAALNQVAQ